MGTMLQLAGMPPGVCPEEWSRSHPDEVKNVSLQYFLAGSDMVLTNTFGIHPVKLDKFGLAGEVGELTRLAVELARRAAQEAGKPEGIVAMSLGPTGDFLKPLGTLDPDDVRGGYRRTASAALDAGADAACIETFTAVDEAVLAVEAVTASGLEALATMSFDKGPAGFRTMMGVTPAQAAQALRDAGAFAVGVNCGSISMAELPELLGEMSAVASPPFIIHANAGRPVLQNGRTVFPEAPAETARHVCGVIEAGARIVGGCCGTTPEHIRAIRKVVDAMPGQSL